MKKLRLVDTLVDTCYFKLSARKYLKLRIRLLDEFGRMIDLNKSDYSLTLKIEQLYNVNTN